uniref:G-protein coupled receptors family 2 profile 2 domain-containing protein n=1 Tax=Caenorhabditis japonica TaxID=281687 RepID=A0A8R1HZY1_CAEJA
MSELLNYLPATVRVPDILTDYESREIILPDPSFFLSIFFLFPDHLLFLSERTSLRLQFFCNSLGRKKEEGHAYSLPLFTTTEESETSRMPLSFSPPMSCRFSNHGEFVPESFDSISCSACFYFIFMLVKPYSERYRTELCADTSGVLICPIGSDDSECNCSQPSNVFNIPDFAINSSLITPLHRLELDPPLPFQFDLVVQDCCSAARYCCRSTLAKHKQYADATCPATWDGWNCFERSNPGTVSKQCPNYIYGGHAKDADGVAVQKCTEMGWKKHELGWREHTDYTGCTSNKGAEAKMIVGLLTYSASVIFLVPAVIMLMWLRPIRCQPMFILHRHLLLSCLAYGFFYLVNVALFVISDAPLSAQIYANHIFCRLLFSIQLRYLRLTNFSWMLAEAVYLWRLLYTAQHTSEDETQKTYKIICWGVPGVITAVYMILRGFNDDVGLCWIENSSVAWVEWMIFAPSLLIMGEMRL